MPSRLSRRSAARRCAGLAAPLLAALALGAAPVRAAEITEVADAMDEKKPLEVDLDVGFQHLRRDTKLTRENLQADAAGVKGIYLVDELQHTQTWDVMTFRLAVGIWHDLEIHILAPFSLREEQTWDFATVNGQSVASTSTLQQNRIDISGCLQTGSCNGPPTPILPTPGRSLRAGFRDPSIGITWGPINEERELRLRPDLYPPGKPVSTWVIGFDYTLPLPGEVDDPARYGAASAGTGLAASGPVARKAHVFSAWTAFSKRFRVADPYVALRASAPVAIRGSGPGDGAADNCWHPERLADVATVNCADPVWKGQTGYQPPYEGGFTLGSEFAFFENAASHQKFSVDLRGDVRYFGPQRGYTQIADALGKLTYSDEYAAFGATLALQGRAARWLHARVAGTIGMETPHLITTEPIGKDLCLVTTPGQPCTSDGRISLSNGQGSLEQSPTYDFRLDQVGRRLRAETAVLWGVSGMISLNF